MQGAGEFSHWYVYFVDNNLEIGKQICKMGHGNPSVAF